MAYITLNTKKLKHNYEILNNEFKKNDIEWAAVVKLLCGNELFINEVLKLGIKEVCDSRISNLKAVKALNPAIQTVYIKPPALENLKEVLSCADVTFNTEYDTIKELSDTASKMGITHKILIMIELGELREGVMREEFVEFYQKVFDLPNIKVTGIGANLSCMYGVLPNEDKLLQLCLYKELVELKFNQKIPYISGGTSVTLPLLHNKSLPKGINHFRVGDSLFLGSHIMANSHFKNMYSDTFKLYAQIIELNQKPCIPSGDMGLNMSGEQKEFESSQIGKLCHRAIVDIGLLDIEDSHLMPIDEDLKIIGSSSDMMVIDLNHNEAGLEVGDFIEFKMDYMGILRIMNSDYIEKKLESNESEVD